MKTQQGQYAASTESQKVETPNTFFGPCLDLLYIQTDSSWSKAHVHAMTTFWDHVSAMFGQCWNYI